MNKLISTSVAYNLYFIRFRSFKCLLQHSTILKITVVVCLLLYGVASEFMDENLSITNSIVQHSILLFYNSFIVFIKYD